KRPRGLKTVPRRMYWPPRFSSSQPAIRTTSPGKCWPPTAVQPPDGSPGAHSCKSRRSIRYSRSCCFYAPQGHTKREYLMLTRSLGANGPTSSAIGLGCMGMSDFYGPSDRAESIATIRMALDANVTLLDSGDFYGMGHNEMLIAEAIQGRPRDQIILSVKFGAQRDPEGKWVGFDARPAAVKTTWGKIFNSGLLGGSVPVRAAIQGCLCRVYGRGGPSL